MSVRQRLAKFTIPRQRGVTARPRLFEVLDAARGAPGVWLGGAPGAGKTTLAASYVRACQAPCLWFGVDAADNDLAELFSGLSVAAGDTPRQRQRLPVFGAEHAPRVALFARRYFRQLYERLPAHCCVVFDNLHALDEDGPALEVVRIAIEEAPAEVQILLLSRTAPPAQFAALEAARKLERLDEQALGFTPEELQALLPGHDRAVLSAIHELTQGWSAGIVLASHCWSAKRVQCGRGGDAQADSKEAIFRFFAHEVMRTMPAHEQRFLQVVSLLPEMSVAQAQALTQEDEAERILEAVYRRNLFTSYRRGNPNTYQFHALFREYLRGQAQARLGSEELSQARRHAAQLLLVGGNVPAALDLLITAAEWDLACATLVDSAPLLLREGRYATLRRWIEVLPAATLESNAWLMYWMGQARAREDEMAACDWYERAYRRFESVEHDPLGRALGASAALVAIHVAEATFKDLGMWSQRLRDTLDGLPRPLLPADDLAVAAAIAVASILGAPVLPEQQTLATMKRVLALLEADPSAVDAEIVAAGYSLLSYCQAERNEVMFARILKVVEPQLRDARINPLARSRWLMAVSLSYFAFALNPGAEGKIEAACAAARKARVIVEREELLGLEFDLLLLEAQLASFEHDRARYTELVLRIGTRVDFSRPFSLEEYSVMLCGVHLRRGEVAEALAAAERGQAAAQLAEAPPMRRLQICMAHGLALIMAERTGEAASLVESLICGLDGRLRLVAEAFVSLAQAWRVRGAPDRYLPLLRQGMHQAVRCTWTNFFLYVPDVCARLCADALKHGIEPEFVRACIEKRRLMPPADAGERWPWPIQVRVLGPFELQRDGQAAQLGSKTPRRQVELLQAVAASGAAGLDTWQALDWIWPAGESGKNPLEVTLHRLRKLLGEPGAVVIKDGRLGFDRTLVWSDVAQFEGLSAELLAADLGALSDTQLQAQAARVLALYRGPLLAGGPQSAWVLNARAQFHARFERVVQALGAQLERRTLWAVALDLYTRALAHDNLAEEFYRGQIRCHLALAQPAQALQAFRRCRQLLSVVLGVAPAPQTLALMRDLRERA